MDFSFFYYFFFFSPTTSVGAFYCSNECKTSHANLHKLACDRIVAQINGRTRTMTYGNTTCCSIDLGITKDSIKSFKNMKPKMDESFDRTLELVERAKSGELLAILSVKDRRKAGVHVPCYSCAKPLIGKEAKRWYVAVSVSISSMSHFFFAIIFSRV